jgi:hypothetical protein
VSVFFTFDTAVSTTAVKYIDSADFDRVVNLRSFTFSTAEHVYIGFSSSDVDFRLPDGGPGTEASDSPAVNIVLPAGQELWAKSSTGEPSLIAFVGGSPG